MGTVDHRRSNNENYVREALFFRLDGANFRYRKKGGVLEELLRYMRAMVMLQLHSAQVQSLQHDEIPLRAELLLADAGFSAREVSEMLSKSPAAVAKAISRGRSARRGKGDPGDDAASAMAVSDA